jgi:hypothetical protein
MKFRIFGFTTVVFLMALVFSVFAQNLSQSISSQIKLSAFVDKTESPLNRPITLTIRLEWIGDLDRFKVHPFDNPITQNLEIDGNASSNNVAAVNGVNKSVSDHEFTLKPTNLGMAYVEGVIVRYTDLTTDKEHSLTTNRIEVKILDPLPEPGSKLWMLWCAVILVFFAGAILLILRIKKQQVSEHQKELDAIAAIPIEEKYLTELKSLVDFNGPNLNRGDAVSIVSRLLRNFVSEKFAVSGLEVTTEQVLQELAAKNLDARFLNDVKNVLTTSDKIKFTGGSSNKAELERLYTLVEASLQKSLRGELTKDSVPEQQDNKHNQEV